MGFVLCTWKALPFSHILQWHHVLCPLSQTLWPPWGHRFVHGASICVCSIAAKHFVESKLLTQDWIKRWLILNAVHLAPQMVLAGPLRSHRGPIWNAVIILYEVSPHFLVSCLMSECSARLFPAAWAPANCSPAALRHTNPPSVRMWRFTVC